MGEADSSRGSAGVQARVLAQQYVSELWPKIASGWCAGCSSKSSFSEEGHAGARSSSTSLDPS